MADWITSVDKVLDFVHKKGFTGISHFLDIYLLIPSQDGGNPRSMQHRNSVVSFLAGNDTFKASHLVERLYNHPSSQPQYFSTHRAERELFTSLPPERLHFARPALSSWALKIVGEKAHREVGKLTKLKESDEEGLNSIQLCVGTNGRGRKTRIVTWDDIKNLDIMTLGTCFKKEAPVTMRLLECMAAPRKDGMVVVRKRRPFHLVSYSMVLLLYAV
jgi:hypothetical protein